MPTKPITNRRFLNNLIRLLNEVLATPDNRLPAIKQRGLSLLVEVECGLELQRLAHSPYLGRVAQRVEERAIGDNPPAHLWAWERFIDEFCTLDGEVVNG